MKTKRRGQFVLPKLRTAGLLGVASLALAEILVRLGGWHPLLELGSNLRPHLLVASVLVLAILLLARDRLAWGAGFLVLLGVLQLAPYWFASPDDPIVGGTDFVVMQFNIAAPNQNFDQIAERVVAADPDVLVITELTTEQWVNISARLPQLGFTIAEPWDDQQESLGGGMAILSKTPIDSVDLPEAVSPPHRPVLGVSVAVAEQQVLVIGMHPHASRTDSTKIDLRQAQLEAVAALASEQGALSVVAGDLNLAPTSTQYRSFLDDLDWRDPHKAVGWNATWNFHDLPLGLPVDHVLASDDIAMLAYDIGDGAGSDHRTVTARMSIPPG